ncbi:MAG: hypothetical protein DLM72_20415 [Candidatus Nitrosopolaris wilkensis]|nr:MAG: hypothetical protein DLM72_20415 [Candidatus Nitrosopolaris wilkensis]
MTRFVLHALLCSIIRWENTVHPKNLRKKCSESELLKMFRSDQSFAIGRTITNSLYHKYSVKIVPSQLNDDLANEAQYRLSQIDRHKDTRSNDDIHTLYRFLHPRDMSGVLKFLENEGV